jgi:flagellar hook-length control protein FliK
MKIEPVTLFSHSRSFEPGAVQAPIDSHAQGMVPAFTVFALDIDPVPEPELADVASDAPLFTEAADTATVELPDMEPNDSAPNDLGPGSFLSREEPRLGWSGAMIHLRFERELLDNSQTHLKSPKVADQPSAADNVIDHASLGLVQTGAKPSQFASASGLLVTSDADVATVSGPIDPTHHQIHRPDRGARFTPGDGFIPAARPGTEGTSAGLVQVAPMVPTATPGEDHDATPSNSGSAFAAQQDGPKADSRPDRQALTERATQITGSSPAIPAILIAQAPSSNADMLNMRVSSGAGPTEHSTAINAGELRTSHPVQSLPGPVLGDPVLTHSAVQAQEAKTEPKADGQTSPGPSRGLETSQPALRQVFDAILRSPDGRIDLRLSPEELGGLRLTLIPEGSSIRVMIESDRIETQDLLRRHSQDLERALRDAGFENPSFEFSQDRRAPQIFQTLRHDQEVLQASLPPDTALHVTGIGRLDLRL